MMQQADAPLVIDQLFFVIRSHAETLHTGYHGGTLWWNQWENPWQIDHLRT